jgi:hypothetical protein
LIEKGIDANLRALSRDLRSGTRAMPTAPVAPLVPAPIRKCSIPRHFRSTSVERSSAGGGRSKWVAIAERWLSQPDPWAQACGLNRFFFLNGKHFPSTAVPEVAPKPAQPRVASRSPPCSRRASTARRCASAR